MSMTIISALSKYLAVGALVVGGAVGVYALSTTQGEDETQLAGQTVTVPDGTPADVTAVPVETPQTGLTDTGYKTRDGRTLYRECMPDLPLPPTYLPIPTLRPEPVETQDPDFVLPAEFTELQGSHLYLLHGHICRHDRL
jgi:hypothetical protein